LLLPPVTAVVEVAAAEWAVAEVAAAAVAVSAAVVMLPVWVAVEAPSAR